MSEQENQPEEQPDFTDAAVVTCDIRVTSYLDADGEEKQRLHIEAGASIITVLGLLEHAKHLVLGWNDQA